MLHLRYARYMLRSSATGLSKDRNVPDPLWLRAVAGLVKKPTSFPFNVKSFPDGHKWLALR
jgi:hypothetical protein